MGRVPKSVVLWLACVIATSCAAACRRAPVVNDQAIGPAIKQAVRGEAREVQDFYRRRAFSPAWTSGATPLAAAEQLLAAIRDADADGLRSSDYRLTTIESAVRALRRAPAEDAARRTRLAARADVLLTDAFLLYASHLADGKVDLDTGTARWERASRRANLETLLDQSLRAGTVAGALARLTPSHPHYVRLRTVRRSWRLMLDRRLPDARRRDVERRIERLDLNLERWRWMPRDLGGRHVLVDVASFELAAIDGGREVMRMKIVGGTEAWQTPDFSSAITDFSINPSWNAPRHVLMAELLAYMKQDPNYLANNKMVLLRREGDTEVAIDPTTIDFATLQPDDVDFRLRQDGGPLNVLGRLKFNLPNPHDVYLHDTPYQEDFSKMPRTFSHGCVRVEKPIDLALFLLGGEGSWTRERLAAAVDELTEKRVRLSRPVPTHVLYVTAWANAKGEARFVEDVYHRDAKLHAALATSPPSLHP